ncbi:MAG: hypothetical protein KZQ94_10550 [Candidatus Thiodiazotropha sp. (ex Troendleina suluensis)]|nr:hypothetical protein [Candidatus Thiodiazotropha sp. (ex Troendleina suluensis)]
MERAINQRKAKVLVRDYLRETGRRGVTSLLRDIRKFTGSAVFTQRTFEKWLAEQDRQLNHHNWTILLSFIQSDQFKSHVPYINEGSTEARLKQVAEGFVALYGAAKHPQGMHILPSQINAQGKEAVQLLAGNWENVPNQAYRDVPRTLCKMQPILDERYAKFAYIALFRSKQISATGLVIYLNSDEREDADYCHNFVLQLWRRRDPESDSKMPGALIHLKMKKNQPEFAVSKIINSYFYKEPDPVGARGDVLYALERGLETARLKKTGSYAEITKLKWALDITENNAVILKKAKTPIREEEEIIDQLLEDVLPHGYAEA